jgi:hypothetical protein
MVAIIPEDAADKKTGEQKEERDPAPSRRVAGADQAQKRVGGLCSSGIAIVIDKNN